MYGASADLTLTEAGHLLFMQWIHELSSDELKTTQYAPHGDILPQIEIQPEWRFTGPDGGGFGLSYDPDQSLWVVNCYSNTEQSAVLRIVERAARETQFGNISGKICYHTELTTSKLDFTVELGVQMLRTLGDHVVIEGMSRLSDVVWLEFALLDPPPGASPLIPRTKIAVDIWAPGIKHGPLSARVANSVLETTRLIRVLALGLPLDIPTAIFPAKGADLEQARERISNDSILTLARNTVSLDLFGQLSHVGGDEAVKKVRASMAAFDAAIRQGNADVATILHVSGMEALAVPNADWRKERAVTRFHYATTTLCPEVLDKLLSHEKVTSLFQFNAKGGRKKKRQRFLDRIYDMRSTPVHSGPSMAAPFMEAMAHPGAQRIAFLSELHWNMILGYLQSPVSFIVGHPDISPGEQGCASN